MTRAILEEESSRQTQICNDLVTTKGEDVELTDVLEIHCIVK